MSTNERERLTKESQDGREARLDRMSTNQREILARESQESSAILMITSLNITKMFTLLKKNC